MFINWFDHGNQNMRKNIKAGMYASFTHDSLSKHWFKVLNNTYSAGSADTQRAETF